MMRDAQYWKQAIKSRLTVVMRGHKLRGDLKSTVLQLDKIRPNHRYRYARYNVINKDSAEYNVEYIYTLKVAFDNVCLRINFTLEGST